MKYCYICVPNTQLCIDTPRPFEEHLNTVLLHPDRDETFRCGFFKQLLTIVFKQITSTATLFTITLVLIRLLHRMNCDRWCDLGE